MPQKLLDSGFIGHKSQWMISQFVIENRSCPRREAFGCVTYPVASHVPYIWPISIFFRVLLFVLHAGRETMWASGSSLRRRKLCASLSIWMPPIPLWSLNTWSCGIVFPYNVKYRNVTSFHLPLISFPFHYAHLCISNRIHAHYANSLWITTIFRISSSKSVIHIIHLFDLDSPYRITFAFIINSFCHGLFDHGGCKGIYGVALRHLTVMEMISEAISFTTSLV